MRTQNAYTDRNMFSLEYSKHTDDVIALIWKNPNTERKKLYHSLFFLMKLDHVTIIQLSDTTCQNNC